MKQIKTTLAIITTALIVTCCNKGDDVVTTVRDELGTASFNCLMQSSITKTTRTADMYEIPARLIPSADELSLKITGSYIDPDSEVNLEYSYGPVLLSIYNTSTNRMYASSDYFATFTSGNADAEGESSPYFYGDASFEIIARGTTSEEVEVSLSNSIISLNVVDDIFSNYYDDALFVVTTSAGNSFEFTVPNDKIVFVQAGTSLTLSGSATRNGKSVTFNATMIGQTTAQTMHTIEITAGNIGSNSVNITLDDTVTEMDVITIELNQ